MTSSGRSRGEERDDAHSSVPYQMQSSRVAGLKRQGIGFWEPYYDGASVNSVFRPTTLSMVVTGTVWVYCNKLFCCRQPIGSRIGAGLPLWPTISTMCSTCR